VGLDYIAKTSIIKYITSGKSPLPLLPCTKLTSTSYKVNQDKVVELLDIPGTERYGLSIVETYILYSDQWNQHFKNLHAVVFVVDVDEDRILASYALLQLIQVPGMKWDILLEILSLYSQ
jgi:hypothetical protein